MAQGVLYHMGLCEHPRPKREWEEANNSTTANISPDYYAWTRNGHTSGDFSWATEKDGWKSWAQKRLDWMGGPCTWDDYIDYRCRTHPANKFAAKMTEKRPGEYCDAWTLPRLEACKKAYGE
eukprot:Hpha_TRINITY_DN12899_c0_g1::TRINITY_DN12899_c0_g1_i1::g.24218::m.24218